jgi:hypothetical protein
MDTLSGKQRPGIPTPAGGTLIGYLQATPIRAGLLMVIFVPLAVTILFGSSLDASHVAAATECESLSRVVANRNHSMLDGDSLRKTQLSAYRTCIADPSAFRRLMR